MYLAVTKKNLNPQNVEFWNLIPGKFYTWRKIFAAILKGNYQGYSLSFSKTNA